MKGTATLRRLKIIKNGERRGRIARADKHQDMSAWQRARYEQAPEMITHMLQVR